MSFGLQEQTEYVHASKITAHIKGSDISFAYRHVGSVVYSIRVNQRYLCY